MLFFTVIIEIADGLKDVIGGACQNSLKDMVNAFYAAMAGIFLQLPEILL